MLKFELALVVGWSALFVLLAMADAIGALHLWLVMAMVAITLVYFISTDPLGTGDTSDDRPDWG